jgi:protein tyrosine/serine phosphatase
MGKLGFVASALVVAIALSGCAHNNGATRDGSSGGDLTAGGDGGQGVPCRQQVLSGEVTNARGLDGVLLADGYKVACGTLFRGGDLSALGSAGCAEFATLGIKTVIDLRQASVQQTQPPAACVSSQAKLVSAAMPKLLPDTPQNYLALLQEKAAVAAVFATLADTGAYPVYTHCVIGRDRASFVAALVLLALGADRQAVVDEFVLSEGAGVPVQVPCIEAVLDEIDKQGGIQAYLTSVGVTEAQLSALRAAARAK